MAEAEAAVGRALLVEAIGDSWDERAEIEACLRTMDDVQLPEADEPERTVTFLRAGSRMHASWENTIVGRAVMADGTLRLETNSVRRADALRQRLEMGRADTRRDRCELLARLDAVPRSRESRRRFTDRGDRAAVEEQAHAGASKRRAGDPGRMRC